MKKLTWQLSLTVDKTWIEDGFDLTQEEAESQLSEAIRAYFLPYAYGDEVNVTIKKRPDKKAIEKMQGL